MGPCTAYGGTRSSKHPTLAFFCTFWYTKTLLRGQNFPGKKKFFFSRFFKNRLVFGKNHEISGSQNHVLDPHRCSKVPNFALNGLKSSKLALFRGEKKKFESPFPWETIARNLREKKNWPDFQIWPDLGSFFFFLKKKISQIPRSGQIWPDLETRSPHLENEPDLGNWPPNLARSGSIRVFLALFFFFFFFFFFISLSKKSCAPLPLFSNVRIKNKRFL